MLEIAARQDVAAPAARLHHAHSLHAATVALPPLPIGATFLERWTVHEEPRPIDWRATSYVCMAPATFVLRDVILHSSAGIIQIDGEVVRETLACGAPHLHGYQVAGDDIALLPRRVRYLGGRHISILSGNTRNYFHALLDGVFRLSMLPDYYLHASQSLLHPAAALAQTDVLDLLHLPDTLGRLAVADSDALHIDALVFPWDLYGVSSFHPCILAWFDRISAAVDAAGDFPRRIYVDRRASGLRQLIDEAALVAALRPLGFVAVRPELLSVADQIRLFRGAEAIVAPHGAALTNIGFCRPGCVLLELHMDAYVHWVYRHMAALRGLVYDCVLGRAAGPWPAAPAQVHGLQWRIHVPHVVAAVSQMMQAGPRA